MHGGMRPLQATNQSNRHSREQKPSSFSPLLLQLTADQSFKGSHAVLTHHSLCASCGVCASASVALPSSMPPHRQRERGATAANGHRRNSSMQHSLELVHNGTGGQASERRCIPRVLYCGSHQLLRICMRQWNVSDCRVIVVHVRHLNRWQTSQA